MKSKSIRGKYNSSITRVRPLFGKLLQTDSTGVLWLPQLLRLATCNQDYAARLSQETGTLKQVLLDKLAYKDRILKHYGIESVLLERCFEKLIPPPTQFLKWLIQHPEEMDWPDNGERKYREDTQKNREQLMGMHGADAQASTKRRALYELEKCGATRSDKRWWAFEGCTEADLCLETDKCLLIVEGKRNEPLSSSTEWFSERSQLIRNLEAAKEIASGRDYAVMVVAESELDLDLPKQIGRAHV